ncbi:phage terminase small subunit P27 family [Pontivivens nitratireducens]|uniref:phage terminase small subunit P27 family n=1 Tax=Pontivivens nitratireducens TaxID=2758038 RepID=UPI00163AD868|nr:phage terminase small subunit P27 family [Pontibrevibacter nitratireducens]
MKGRKPPLHIAGDELEGATVPDWFSEDAAREWVRVVPVLSERKILTEADMGCLEAYCVATGTVREMERMLQMDGHVLNEKGALKKHPAVAIQADAMNRARMLASELGLTPVSRSRPKVSEQLDMDELLE